MNVAEEFISASSAVSSMSCLSYIDSLWDGRPVTLQQKILGAISRMYSEKKYREKV